MFECGCTGAPVLYPPLRSGLRVRKVSGGARYYALKEIKRRAKVHLFGTSKQIQGRAGLLRGTKINKNKSRNNLLRNKES